MINSIVEAVVKLAESIKNNPLPTMAAIALVFVLIQNTTTNEKLERVAHPSPQQEGQMLGTAIDADTLINDELHRVMDDTGGDRVLVRQFTNGTKNLGGIPFAFIKTTHVTIAPDIPPPSYGEFPVSSMNNLMRQMFTKGDPKCVAVDVDELRRDPAFVAYLEQHQVKKGYSCPLLSQEGVPMGLVGIGLLEEEHQRLSDDATIQVLENSSAKIASYLSTIRYEVADSKKTWWRFW